MARFIFISAGGEREAIDVAPGTSAMRAAVTHGLDGILAECGGSLACGTCHVYVDPAQIGLLPAPGEDEDALLEMASSERRPNSRLGCQIVMTEDLDGLELHLPPTQG